MLLHENSGAFQLLFPGSREKVEAAAALPSVPPPVPPPVAGVCGLAVCVRVAECRAAIPSLW